jgi:hypothetical protein
LSSGILLFGCSFTYGLSIFRCAGLIWARLAGDVVISDVRGAGIGFLGQLSGASVRPLRAHRAAAIRGVSNVVIRRQSERSRAC